MSDDMHEATFTWPEVDVNEVILTGSFDQWSCSIRLTKTPRGFEGKVRVPWGSHTQYKYVVDGRWRTAESQPEEPDGHGNINNVYEAPSKPGPIPMAVQTQELSAEPPMTSAPEPVEALEKLTETESTLPPAATVIENVTSTAGETVHRIAETVSTTAASAVAAVVGIGGTAPQPEEVKASEDREISSDPKADSKKDVLKEAEEILARADLVTTVMETVPATPGDKTPGLENAIKAENGSPVTDAPVVETPAEPEPAVTPVLSSAKVISEETTAEPTTVAQIPTPLVESTSKPAVTPTETTAIIVEEILTPAAVIAEDSAAPAQKDLTEVAKESTSVEDLMKAANPDDTVSPTDKALVETAVETINEQNGDASGKRAEAPKEEEVAPLAEVPDAALAASPEVKETPSVHVNGSAPKPKAEPSADNAPLDTSLEKSASAPGPMDASVSPVAVTAKSDPEPEKASLPPATEVVSESNGKPVVAEEPKVEVPSAAPEVAVPAAAAETAGPAEPAKANEPKLTETTPAELATAQAPTISPEAPPAAASTSSEPKKATNGNAAAASGPSSTAFPTTEPSEKAESFTPSPKSSRRSSGRFDSIRKKRDSIFGRVKSIFSHSDKDEKK